MFSLNIYEIISLSAIFLLLYVFLLYPAVLAILAKIFHRKINSDEEFRPEITIIISAYNEEELIEGAIRSIYNSDYPSDKITVIVGSDGSSDATVDVVKQLANEYNKLEVYELPRSGKNKALNQLVPKANTEIIFYMDADCRLFPDTLKTMIPKFADKDVGCVISPLEIKSVEANVNNARPQEDSGSAGEEIYQKYEAVIRQNESRVFSTVNTLGACYGIRRELYRPIPNDRVCDDFYSVLNVVLLRKRVIFDTDSIVSEVRKKSLSSELNRKIRIASGGLSTVWACRRLLMPDYGWGCFFLWSHKLLRWLSPIYLILILLSSILAPPDSILYPGLLILQAAFYGMAALGWTLEKMRMNFMAFKMPLFFVSMNVGFCLGIIRFLRGRQNAMWSVDGFNPNISGIFL